jgi:hypothetical protein
MVYNLFEGFESNYQLKFELMCISSSVKDKLNWLQKL